MSDFRNWSKWFEEAMFIRLSLDEPPATETVFAVMAWIIAHADNVGTGFAFDPESPTTIAREIGSTPEKVGLAMDFLLLNELIAEKEHHDNGVVAMQAVLSTWQHVSAPLTRVIENAAKAYDEIGR